MSYLAWPSSLISPAVAKTLRFMEILQRRSDVSRDRRTGAYLITSHDAVAECVGSPHVVRGIGSFDAVRGADASTVDLITHLTSSLDGDEHRVARRATRAGILGFECDPELIVRTQWDSVREKPDLDVVADFARPIALTIARSTSGFAARTGAGLSDMISNSFEHSGLDHRRADRLAPPLCREAAEALAAPRAGTTVDHLGRAWRDGSIDQRTAVGAAAFSSLAAIETLTSALTTLVASVHIDAELAELGRTQPDRLVSEALRLTATVQMFHFDAACDLEVGGVAIPDGSRLLVHYGAACRDASRFDRPHEVSIEPRPSDLAFGRGVHSCLGAALTRRAARAAATAAVERPASRTKTGSTTGSNTAWSSGIFIHTPMSCSLGGRT